MTALSSKAQRKARRHNFGGRISNLTKRFFYVIRNNLYLVTALLCVVYLCILQFPFVSSGDAWAEAFYEYVHGALVSGWQSFFQPGIAGYYNFLPKLLSYPYVILGLPLDKIDYFFRFGIIIFTVACVSFIAHPYNRTVIKNDGLRVSLSLLALMTLTHISTFSMINVWYVGFIPIILISLSDNRFKNEFPQILYAVFALAVCFTKPSIILLPLVWYRMIRHKEYLLGFIITFAIALQSLLLLSSAFYASQAHPAASSLLTKTSSMFLYPGLLLLKTLKIEPHRLAAVILASLLLYVIVLFALKRLGAIRASVLTMSTGITLYTTLFPPDVPLGAVRTNFHALFRDVNKLQRDVVLQFLLMFVIILAIDLLVLNAAKTRQRAYTYAGYSACIVIAFCTFRPIDVTAAGSYVNIDPFRNDLHARTVKCMPITPTALWGTNYEIPAVTYPWYFESAPYGSCGRSNYSKIIDQQTFNLPLSKTPVLAIQLERAFPMRSLAIPLRTTSRSTTATITLKDLDTGNSYVAQIDKRQNDTMTYVIFNINGSSTEDHYRYRITSSNPGVYSGKFTDGSVANFMYYSVY